MIRSLIGRLAAALLLLALGGAPAAEASGYYGGGGSTSTAVNGPASVSGNWMSGMSLGPMQQQGIQSNKIYCTLAVFTAPTTITKIGSLIITAATSGSNLSLMYYADSASHRPGVLMASVVVASTATGVVSGSATASFAAWTRYWQCEWSDGSPTALGQGNNGGFEALLGLDSASSGLVNASNGQSAGVNGYTLSMTYSTTAPADLSGQAVANWSPLIGGTVRVPVLVQ